MSYETSSSYSSKSSISSNYLDDRKDYNPLTDLLDIYDNDSDRDKLEGDASYESNSLDSTMDDQYIDNLDLDYLFHGKESDKARELRKKNERQEARRVARRERSAKKNETIRRERMKNSKLKAEIRDLKVRIKELTDDLSISRVMWEKAKKLKKKGKQIADSVIQHILASVQKVKTALIDMRNRIMGIDVLSEEDVLEQEMVDRILRAAGLLEQEVIDERDQNNKKNGRKNHNISRTRLVRTLKGRKHRGDTYEESKSPAYFLESMDDNDGVYLRVKGLKDGFHSSKNVLKHDPKLNKMERAEKMWLSMQDKRTQKMERDRALRAKLIAEKQKREDRIRKDEERLRKMKSLFVHVGLRNRALIQKQMDLFGELKKQPKRDLPNVSDFVTLDQVKSGFNMVAKKAKEVSDEIGKKMEWKLDKVPSEAKSDGHKEEEEFKTPSHSGETKEDAKQVGDKESEAKAEYPEESKASSYPSVTIAVKVTGEGDENGTNKFIDVKEYDHNIHTIMSEEDKNKYIEYVDSTLSPYTKTEKDFEKLDISKKEIYEKLEKKEIDVLEAIKSYNDLVNSIDSTMLENEDIRNLIEEIENHVNTLKRNITDDSKSKITVRTSNSTNKDESRVSSGSTDEEIVDPPEVSYHSDPPDAKDKEDTSNSEDTSDEEYVDETADAKYKEDTSNSEDTKYKEDVEDVDETADAKYKEDVEDVDETADVAGSEDVGVTRDVGNARHEGVNDKNYLNAGKYSQKRKEKIIRKQNGAASNIARVYRGRLGKLAAKHKKEEQDLRRGNSEEVSSVMTIPDTSKSIDGILTRYQELKKEYKKLRNNNLYGSQAYYNVKKELVALKNDLHTRENERIKERRKKILQQETDRAKDIQRLYRGKRGRKLAKMKKQKMEKARRESIEVSSVMTIRDTSKSIDGILTRYQELKKEYKKLRNNNSYGSKLYYDVKNKLVTLKNDMRTREIARIDEEIERKNRKEKDEARLRQEDDIMRRAREHANIERIPIREPSNSIYTESSSNLSSTFNSDLFQDARKS